LELRHQFRNFAERLGAPPEALAAARLTEPPRNASTNLCGAGDLTHAARLVILEGYEPRAAVGENRRLP